MVFGPAGNVVATGGDDNFLRLWDVAAGHDNKAFKPFLCPLSAVAWNPQGNYLAVAGTDNQMAMMRTRPAFGIVKKFSGHSDCISSLLFSRTTKHLISGSHDRTTRIWDTNSGEQIKQIPSMSAVTCMDINNADTTFCSGHKSGDVRIFSMSNFE